MLQLQVMLQVMQLLCSSVTPLAKATQHSLEPTHEVWPRPSPPPAPLHHAAAHMHAMRGVLTPHPHCTTDPLWEGSTCLHITLRHARVFRRQRPALKCQPTRSEPLFSLSRLYKAFPRSDARPASAPHPQPSPRLAAHPHSLWPAHSRNLYSQGPTPAPQQHVPSPPHTEALI